jgi:DNA-binding SARP family transcriptional activator/WD40 repeat protein
MGSITRGLLEFRVLGSLEAWRDKKPVRLAGERQRALLAILLLHANQPVSMDQLVEHLFGGELSEAAVSAARVAVSRLRRLLENGDSNGLLATRPGGYVLQAAPEQVDAARFERLLVEGQELLAAGDAAAAATRLREALSLWRGPPFADMALLDFVQPEIQRLEELRLLATMERIDAELTLGRDAELIAELEQLVASNPLRERLREQLMIALYRAGRQADALTVYRQTSELLRGELGLEPSRKLQELESSILRQDRSLDPPAAPPTALIGGQETAVCPFKGLTCFERSDAEYFCGRERLVSDLVARLAAATLVGVVGPSGIGKSSLLRAGVLPALSAGALPGSDGWRQVLMRPGEHPCAQLRRMLDGQELEAALGRMAPGERLVVAVDQLEELFTACEQDDERAAFLGQLAAAARETERRALVLVALRADFYGRLAIYPRFAELLSRCHVLVGPMERDELADAIELPAGRAGLEVEPKLVDALVADVAGEPGGLPLLSTTLLELWRTRDGRALGYERHRATGGVRGAVARLAEAVYVQLSEPEQRVARRLMLRLAGGEDPALVRRRVALGELKRIDGAGQVLATLTDARLLTVSDAGEVEVSHEALLREWPRYRAWLEEDRVGRRLHAHLTTSTGEWQTRGRDPADLYRGARLTAALDWAGQHAGEQDSLEHEFLEAGRLEAEREARGQRAQNRRLRILLAGVALLLAASVVAGIVALAQRNTASNEARAALAQQLGAEAVSEPRIDLATLLAREAVNLDRSPDTEGTLLTTLLRSPVAIGTFTLPIDARPQAVTLSPDGNTLAVPDNNGKLWFYDPRIHAVQRPPLTDLGGPEAHYSSDGSLLLYLGSPPAIVVRNAHTLALVTKLKLDRIALTQPITLGPGSTLLIAPDRRSVYWGYSVLDTAGNPGAAFLDRWSLPSGRPLRPTRVGFGTITLSLIDHGTRLAVFDSHGLTILDAHTLSAERFVPIRVSPQPYSAAIGPDGRTATIGTSNGSVLFVDLSTGRTRQGVGAQTSAADDSAGIADVVYSPSGRVSVTTGNDNVVRVWDPTTAAAVEVLTGHGAAVHGAAFSADGQTLYTSSLDGAVFEWDLGGARRFGRSATIGPAMPCCSGDTTATPPLAISPGGLRFATRVGSSIGLFSTSTLQQQGRFTIGSRAGTPNVMAWSPTGAELAVGGVSGAVQLWNVDGPPHLVRSLVGLRSLTGLPEAIESLAFSPSGELVAAGDINHTSGTGPPDGHLALWRTSSGTLLRAPRDLGEPGDSVAFSRDGKALAVGLDNGPTLILDPTSEKLRRVLRPVGSADHEGTIALAFAPDGTLATGSYAGIVQLWDPASGVAHAHPVHVAPGPVGSIAFDPAGDRFATTGFPSTQLWFTATLQQEGASLSSTSGGWAAAAFTPDGRRLIVIQADGTGFAWPVSPDAWEQHACAVAGRNFTREEWSRFVTGHSYMSACP